ncbi:MAG: YicC family protein [Cellvibrionaceae bacterium]|nr:YicC family protein [Cellvibrionaceae bacterium]
MPSSMTGFARHTLTATWGDLSCEIRSVNHRYFEPMIRLPEALRSEESAMREQLRKGVHRGKLDIVFQLAVNSSAAERILINQSLAKSLIDAARQLRDQVPEAAPLDLLGVLQWPGMLQDTAVDEQAIKCAAGQLLQQAMATLLAHRQREGEQLQQHIQQRLDAIDEQLVSIREQLPAILNAQRERLQSCLAELQALDETRLEQEMLLLANKTDVAEELDRLQSHLVEVRRVLQQRGPIGRRLDFMMQELNREANTLSSKSIATMTTQAAVSIKVFIEQMREQIQNIE